MIFPLKRESIAFLISGAVFGLLIGWMIGSQQASPAVAPQAAAAAAPPAAQDQAQGQPAAPPLDTQRAAELQKTADADPKNAAVRTELANLYFNAERFEQAIPLYEAVLKLTPRDVNASTDLGVCYYYTQQDDRALAQFDHSLSIDPKHVKTLFNQGIVRAFGKQDLTSATESWQKVLAIAPDSEEGKRAKQIIDGLRNGHSGANGQPGAPVPPAGQGR
jgi:tetratricopeptide (TPR) repeat protein